MIRAVRSVRIPPVYLTSSRKVVIWEDKAKIAVDVVALN